MKIPTPEGIVDGKPLEFSLQEAEKPVKIVLEDGRVLQWRATVGAVFCWKDSNGVDQFCVTHNTSAVQIQ
jgi:hypothetical protein